MVFTNAQTLLLILGKMELIQCVTVRIYT